MSSRTSPRISIPHSTPNSRLSQSRRLVDAPISSPVTRWGVFSTSTRIGLAPPEAAPPMTVLSPSCSLHAPPTASEGYPGDRAVRAQGPAGRGGGACRMHTELVERSDGRIGDPIEIVEAADVRAGEVRLAAAPYPRRR